jgi:hypothetical protein
MKEVTRRHKEVSVTTQQGVWYGHYQTNTINKKTMKRKIKALTKGIEKFKCDDREIDKIDSSLP